MNKNELKSKLQKLGIEKNMKILLHVSLSKIGYLDNGPETLIESIEELISPFSKRHPLLILIVLRIMSPCCALSTNLINTLYQAKITIKITYMVKKLTKTA